MNLGFINRLYPVNTCTISKSCSLYECLPSCVFLDVYTGAESDRQAVLTMYQTPRMMVPVRTWQHRQQLVEYQRSHGEIIILSLALSQAREH